MELLLWLGIFLFNLFIHRSQGNPINRTLNKVSCGLKYMSDSFATDVTYEIMSKKFTTSAVYSVLIN